MDVIVTPQTTEVIVEPSNKNITVQDTAIVQVVAEKPTLVVAREPEVRTVAVGIQGPPGPPGEGGTSTGGMATFICTPQLIEEDIVVPDYCNGIMAGPSIRGADGVRISGGDGSYLRTI